MWPPTLLPARHHLGCLAALFAAVGLSGCSRSDVSVAILVIDAATGEPTPSRLEVMDSDNQPHIANNAIPVTLECLLSPLPEWLAPLLVSSSILNPYAGAQQFYADGTAELSLPPGAYRLRVAKGPEYRRVEQTLEVVPGEPQRFIIELERWVDPASEGWYGVDDHLHITRKYESDNHRIARWMRAEGLHVANLLEMGTQTQISVTPQYSFGDGGAYRDGPLLLLSGEEHPRTHFLGHTITLGTEERVDRRDEYIVYETTFAEGARLGGVSGFAHYGMRHAHDGLAIAAPTGLVRFVEVLQFEYPHYDVWYQLLNLGFRIAPSAGTDFPCGPPSLPGRERFYAQIEGEVNRRSFVEAVRAGRTFVSNGPIIGLLVDGVGPGGDVALAAPGIVTARGRLRFDPAQDRIDAVELVVNGEVIQRISQATGPGEFEFQRELNIERSAWVALRASGSKPADDGPMPPPVPDWGFRLFDDFVAGGGGPELVEFRNTMKERPSAAHSGAVYVNVAGTSVGSRDSALPAAWLARLAELEDRLSDGRIGEIPIADWIPYSDGVSEQHLRRNRGALLEAIARARVYYEDLGRDRGDI